MNAGVIELVMKSIFRRAFRGLALEMGVSKCHLESVPFHLVFLLQRLTSMMEDLLQVRPSKQDNSACFFVFFNHTTSNNLFINFANSSPWDTAAH